MGTSDLPHADGGSDGVADRSADEVEVLHKAAKPRLASTQVSSHGTQVSVVAGARDGIRASIAIRQQKGGEVCHKCKGQQNGRPCDPAQLGDAPGQRQHAGSDDGCDDMRGRRPKGS